MYVRVHLRYWFRALPSLAGAGEEQVRGTGMWLFWARSVLRVVLGSGFCAFAPVGLVKGSTVDPRVSGVALELEARSWV